jgi:hypothetical protein
MKNLKRIAILILLMVVPAFAVTIDCAKNGLTEDSTATTHTCQWAGADCPAGTYYIQACNDDSGTDVLYVAVGNTAVNTDAGTVSHEIKKGECFGPMKFQSISFSAIAGAGLTVTPWRYSFTRTQP